MIFNPILATDSYKFSHFMQYPKGTTLVKSYVTARGSKIPGVTAVVCAGLQIFIHEYLSKRVTKTHVDQAEAFCAKHGVPFNREGWDLIVTDHGGYIPVEIRSVDEGTPVPLNELMISVINTDDRLPWVTSYIETLLLSYVWYASTVATKSREIKKVIKKYLDISSDNPDAELPFKLHDFGYRGATPGAAHVGAYAHLINFLGTDTVAGIEAAMAYYGSDVCGYSISASEHSTMTSWGRDGEFDAYRNMVDSYAKPGAIFACVIDSYDTFAAIDMFCDDRCAGGSLLDIVKNRGATIVLRPDSGDPVQMPIEVIKYLMEKIGYDINEKGYKVLPSHVRVIQGDGIDIEDVENILDSLDRWGISASNIAFGMGGGLLQKVNRDTFKFAMKACMAYINGKKVEIIKDPVTDPGKKSKAGDLSVYRNRQTGEWKTITEGSLDSFAFNKPSSQWMRKDHVVYSHNESRTLFHQFDMDTVRRNAAL
ncbi:nicotinamide phosphoribosyltransferase [Xanthomonas phage BUDD]|nr:nicotinamide phosphoribosyltransferase [Xanthomonas phage BUDD]